ncbi:hypothetical protein A4X06_0g2124 [Tilletia controversa]|uniref:DNA breaking-rejoining enzyme n=4 Tax=Tilletia TaxID=13289 RepID=A0A8X7MX02_9BASI|nr:hypothetical protein A4X06_0g2124 [Tilletia controversa]
MFPTPRAPTPSSTPTPESSALKPTKSSFASGSGLPFVPPKPKKRNGPNKPGSYRIPVVPTVDRPEAVDGPERFTRWRPPRHLRPPTNRSDREEEAVRQAIIASFAPGTKKGYGTAMAHWHRFCDEHEVAEERRCPADPELVELWIAKEAGIKSGGYLSDWVSGLKAWHHLNNVPWLAEGERLRLVKRGARYEQPPPRPPRAPMTAEWLAGIMAWMRVEDPAEVAAVALTCCGVWGLFRLGELVVGEDGFDPNAHVTRYRIGRCWVRDRLTYTVRLPRTKTQHQGETVVLTQQDHVSNPIGMLAVHTSTNPTNNPAGTPLFAYREGSVLVAMTRTKFLDLMAVLAERAGLEKRTGHSMRIGGCTSLLKKGVPLEKVMLQGRWDSNSWKRYVRDHAEILAPYLVGSETGAEDRA